jgi:hypothetical protein
MRTNIKFLFHHGLITGSRSFSADPAGTGTERRMDRDLGIAPLAPSGRPAQGVHACLDQRWEDPEKPR